MNSQFSKKGLMIALSAGAFALAAPLTLAANVVNIDARSNCGTNPTAANPVEVSLNAGKWLLTPTNPSIDPEANFTAWSAWGDNRSFNAVRFSSMNGVGTLGTGDVFPDAQSAFDAQGNLPVELELTAPDTVKLYSYDNYCSDNSGGISIRIEKIPPLLAAGINLTATVNGNGVDLTLTTSAEPDTAALSIVRGEKLENGGTKINVVCEFHSGGSPYTCTDTVVGDNYRVLETEYDGDLIVYDEVTPK